MDQINFELTPDHVKLIRKMNVRWNDSMCGAPEIDAKRPYGNSDHVADICEILGWEKQESDDGESYYPKGTHQKAEALHMETEKALQVCLTAGTFEPGTYVARKYYNDWKRA